LLSLFYRRVDAAHEWCGRPAHIVRMVNTHCAEGKQQ